MIQKSSVTAGTLENNASFVVSLLVDNALLLLDRRGLSTN
jgi:hypothetical protein